MDPEAVARQRASDPVIDHDNPLEEVFGDQLACADLVILNKTDLVAPERLAVLRGDIAARLRPGVKLLDAEFAELVDDDREPMAGSRGEQVAHEARFPGAEKAGDDRRGDPAH